MKFLIISLLFNVTFGATIEYDYQDQDPTDPPIEEHHGEEHEIQKGCLSKLARSDGCMDGLDFPLPKGHKMVIHGKAAFDETECPMEGSHMDHVHINEEPECFCPYCDPLGNVN